MMTRSAMARLPVARHAVQHDQDHQFAQQNAAQRGDRSERQQQRQGGENGDHAGLRADAGQRLELARRLQTAPPSGVRKARTAMMMAVISVTSNTSCRA